MAQNQEKLRQGSQTSLPSDARPGKLDRRQLQIFDEAELNATRSSAHKVRELVSETFMARLCAAGSHRPMIPPGPAWKANLEWLSHVFPGFEEIVEIGISPSLRAATLGALPRPTPLLVTGAATQEVDTFVRAVAGALDVAFFQFDVATVIGSTCNRPSTVLTTLAFGTVSHAAVANPVGSAHLGPLHTQSEMQSAECLAKLLSVDDAQMMRDPNVPDVHFDASFIRWILSCTDIDQVPVEILNQCHVMRVSPRRGS